MNRTCKILAAAATLAIAATAQAVPVSLTKLSGITGGSPAGTAVYKADLSGLGLATILSIGIRDNSGSLGGSPGQFSGFDLDAIKLSTTDCADAACAQGAAGLSVFDFALGVVFSPGTQRTPVDPKLFGTDASGLAVDNAVATLGAFDAASSTVTPAGFLSMGDNGVIDFNLTAATSTAGLFLYIGEVGDNGEVAASSILVRDTTSVPEPAGLAFFGLLAAGLATLRRRRD
jgi:MYXO-CTERM domain-containing protein